MNSERLTDRDRREARRRIRERNRRILITRSIVLVLILVVVMLLAFLCIKLIRENKVRDWYDAETRFGNIIREEITSNRLEPKGAGVCVVKQTDTGPTENFSPEAGLVACAGEPYARFSKNALVRMNPASTTKIMTAILTLKNCEMNEKVVIPQEAWIDEPGASLAGIRPGQTLTVQQLLYGLMLPSGNDCAAALAVHIAGSIEAFADMMNAEAARIGAVHTHFTNPHGLTDENHYTTAYDLYLMTNEAMQDERFIEISGSKSYTAEFTDVDGLAISRTWNNSNKYVSGKENMPENLKALCGKTGTTLAAGSCLVMVSESPEGVRTVSVILKAKNRDTLYENMNYLLLNFNY